MSLPCSPLFFAMKSIGLTGPIPTSIIQWSDIASPFLPILAGGTVSSCVALDIILS